MWLLYTYRWQKRQRPKIVSAQGANFGQNKWKKTVGCWLATSQSQNTTRHDHAKSKKLKICDAK